jgi:hypothetical protein
MAAGKLTDALQVFGMDIGLATVLSTMGTVWTGDPLSLSPGFSIDGYHPKVMNLLGNLLGLLGKPRGVSVVLVIGSLLVIRWRRWWSARFHERLTDQQAQIARSHGWLESDASLTRDDLYVTGDASTMSLERFEKLNNRADEDGIISEDAILEHSVDALQECIATNRKIVTCPLPLYGLRMTLTLSSILLLWPVHGSDRSECRHCVCCPIDEQPFVGASTRSHE